MFTQENLPYIIAGLLIAAALYYFFVYKKQQAYKEEAELRLQQLTHLPSLRGGAL